MKIYLGADHNGYEFKKKLEQFLHSAGYETVDESGAGLNKDDDFPQFASKVATALLSDADSESRGILICGSGQGMCMAANRFKGIRASLCWNIEEARAARNDDDSNVLCLSSKYSTLDEIKPIIMAWLNTPFAAAPRFVRRLQQLDTLG